MILFQEKYYFSTKKTYHIRNLDGSYFTKIQITLNIYQE